MFGKTVVEGGRRMRLWGTERSKYCIKAFPAIVYHQEAGWVACAVSYLGIGVLHIQLPIATFIVASMASLLYQSLQY